MTTYKITSRWLHRIIFTLLLQFSLLAHADPTHHATTGNATAMQDGWAIANYQLSGDAQVKAFEDLITLTSQTRKKYPDDVAVLIWEGIIKSTYAGIKGGLGALSLARESRAALEKALEMDGKALDGAAYTSLGTLYFKMPGWPVAFGDQDKARTLLDKALVIDPNGIDSNYFYADFLMSNKKYKEAEVYLLKAQQAAPRVNREVADEGRQKDISKALEVVHHQLHNP